MYCPKQIVGVSDESEVILPTTGSLESQCDQTWGMAVVGQALEAPAGIEVVATDSRLAPRSTGSLESQHHIKRHFDERMYCPKCWRVASRFDAWKRHLKSKHHDCALAKGLADVGPAIRLYLAVDPLHYPPGNHNVSEEIKNLLTLYYGRRGAKLPDPQALGSPSTLREAIQRSLYTEEDERQYSVLSVVACTDGDTEDEDWNCDTPQQSLSHMTGAVSHDMVSIPSLGPGQPQGLVQTYTLSPETLRLVGGDPSRIISLGPVEGQSSGWALP